MIVGRKMDMDGIESDNKRAGDQMRCKRSVEV